MDYFSQLTLDTIALAAFYALLGLGFNLLFSTGRFFDLSYAAYLSLGAYIFLGLTRAGLPSLASLVLAVLVAGAFALGVERFFYDTLRKRGSSNGVMMIASLGILTVAQAVVALLFTSGVQTLGATSPTVMILGIATTRIRLLIIFAAPLLYALTYALLTRSTFGVQVRAVSDNDELAASSGLPVRSIRLRATFIGASIGALATILHGMDASIDPGMGMSLLLKGVIVAIIGGLGSPMYGAAGAVLLAVIESSVIWYIGAEWKDAVAFAILILVLLVRPTGLQKR